MIHGLPNGFGWLGATHRALDWTDGCVAVTDAEMDEIWGTCAGGNSYRNPTISRGVKQFLDPKYRRQDYGIGESPSEKGNVNRLVEAALRVSTVEYVMAFRSLVISLLLFGADWRTSERHFVSAQKLPMRK